MALLPGVAHRGVMPASIERTRGQGGTARWVHAGSGGAEQAKWWATPWAIVSVSRDYAGNRQACRDGKRVWNVV